MKFHSLSLIFLSSTLSFSAFSVTSSGYKVCPRVSTGFVAALKTDRTIVVNYHPESDYFVVLRCGEEQRRSPSVVGVDNSCHVYRASSYLRLCEKEKRHSKTTKLLADVIDGVPTVAITGGVSAAAQVGMVVKTVRALGLQPECLGVSLLKAVATSNNVNELLEAYYNVQVELAPFTGLVKIMNGKRKSAKNAWIFNSLDGLLVGGNGSKRQLANEKEGTEDRVILKGPAHLVVRRDRRTVTLLVNEEEQASLCVQFPHIN